MSAIDAVKKYRVGLFVNELSVLLCRLTPKQFFDYHRFRVEYVQANKLGLPDDDAALAKALKCKAWPEVKAELLRQGCIYQQDGMLRDRDLDGSMALQRGASERASANATKRWTNLRKIDGGAA